MKGVVWKKLTLSGFGPFQSTVTVHLEPGFNVIVADNEQGKSTIVAGLTAVLFGLPASSDPTEFGQAKFKNWYEPLRFDGELQFTKGDVLYRVRRNFADHKVTVSVRTEDGWTDHFGGRHNPKARRRNVHYEQFLSDIVGIVDDKLFSTVFTVGSPLPDPEALDDDIQRLLTGAGSAHYTDALQRLQSATFQMTKFSKGIGVATRDRGNDGELEKVQEQIARLEQQISASRDAVDEQQQLQKRLHELEQERRAAKERRRRGEAALQAWTTWRDARNRHRRWLAEQSKLLQAWTQYDDLARRLADDERRLTEQFPELVGQGDDIGDKLESLREAEAKKAAEEARLRGDLAATVERAAEKVAAWRTFTKKRDELASLDADLKNEFSVFVEADKSALAEYARFDVRRETLIRRVHDARRDWGRMRAELDRRAEERARFEEQYGDLAGLDDEAALAAIEERLAALRRKDELSARKAALHEGKGLPFVEWRSVLARPLFVAGMVASAGVFWLASNTVGPLGAVVASVMSLALFGGIALHGERRARLRKALQQIDDELDELQRRLQADERLGCFATAAAHELGVLSQRLAARREAAAALAETAKAVPLEDDDLAAAEERLCEAEGALREFELRVQPGVDRFGEQVTDAYRRWSSLRLERERLQQELTAWVEQRFGRAVLQAETISLTDATRAKPASIWARLADIAFDVAEKSGRPAPQTVGEFVDELVTWTGERAEWVVAQAVGALQARQTTPLQQRVADLRRQLHDLLTIVDGDVAAAQSRWQRFKAMGENIRALRSQLSGLLAGQGVTSPDELHMKALDAQSRAADARRQMERLSEKYISLPPPDEAEDVEGVEQRLVQLEQEAIAAQKAEEEAAEQRRVALERAALLRGSAVINIAAAELELAALKQREKQLQFEIQATALAFQQLAAAAEQFEQSHRDVLAQSTSKYMQQFTGRARRVVFDEQFRVQVQDPDGPVHAVAQLSTGTRDQLYLALRLAIADFVGDDVPLPFVLDDPFVHWDERRMERMRQALQSVQKQRQVILLSHRQRFQSWGHNVEPEGEGWVRR